MSDVNSLFKSIVTTIAGDINNDIMIKEVSNSEDRNKNSENSFLCSICQKNSTDLKLFFHHLELHYLPESPEHFQCCNETFKAQVEFYIHLREHYNSSLINKTGSSLTALVKSHDEIEANVTVNDNNIFNDMDDTTRKNSYQPSDNENLNPDLDLEKVQESSDRHYACVRCHKSFCTNDSLGIHLKLFKDGECAEIHDEKPYVCAICGAKCQTQINLQRHSTYSHLSQRDVKERGQHPSKERTVTNESIDSDEGDAIPLTDMQQYYCGICEITYQTGKSLKRHMLIFHSVEEDDDVIGKYSCQHCQLTFTLKRFLKTHSCQVLRKTGKNLEKICQCDQCGRAFSSNGQLSQHLLNHMAEFPFKCTECPKAYKTEYKYKKHMTFHNKEDIQCEFCKQMCISVLAYKLHIRRKHRYTLECEVCKREFNNTPSFRTHMRIHNKEKPYACTECTFSFHSKSSLFNHNKNIHTEFMQGREQSHVCHICGKAYFTTHRLKVHTESHNELRSHLCTQCGNGFKGTAGLKKHMERHNTPEIPCSHCNLLFTCKSNLIKHVVRRHKNVVKV